MIANSERQKSTASHTATAQLLFQTTMSLTPELKTSVEQWLLLDPVFPTLI